MSFFDRQGSSPGPCIRSFWARLYRHHTRLRTFPSPRSFSIYRVRFETPPSSRRGFRKPLLSPLFDGTSVDILILNPEAPGTKATLISEIKQPAFRTESGSRALAADFHCTVDCKNLALDPPSILSTCHSLCVHQNLLRVLSHSISRPVGVGSSRASSSPRTACGTLAARAARRGDGELNGNIVATCLHYYACDIITESRLDLTCECRLA